MRTETDLVLGLRTFTFKYSVSFSTTLPLTVMGNSDDILLYFDIRHYDMNMPYTCLMPHISIADQWLLSNTKWKSFRIQCILMKDIMWSLPANVLKTFWNTSLHFNISFCHAAFFATSLGGRDSSSITKSQNTFSTILLCSTAVTALETNDPETLFKFSYKCLHSQQSFALVLLLFGTWNRRGKQLSLPWPHRTAAAHSNCCSFSWSHHQNHTPKYNIYRG